MVDCYQKDGDNANGFHCKCRCCLKFKLLLEKKMNGYCHIYIAQGGGERGRVRESGPIIEIIRCEGNTFRPLLLDSAQVKQTLERLLCRTCSLFSVHTFQSFCAWG